MLGAKRTSTFWLAICFTCRFSTNQFYRFFKNEQFMTHGILTRWTEFSISPFTFYSPTSKGEGGASALLLLGRDRYPGNSTDSNSSSVLSCSLLEIVSTPQNHIVLPFIWSTFSPGLSVWHFWQCSFSISPHPKQARKWWNIPQLK